MTIFVRRGARSGVRINLHTTCETRSGKPEPSVMILCPDLQFGVSAILKQRLKYECVMFATQRDGCKMGNVFQHLVKACLKQQHIIILWIYSQARFIFFSDSTNNSTCVKFDRSESLNLDHGLEVEVSENSRSQEFSTRVSFIFSRSTTRNDFLKSRSRLETWE